VTKRACWTWGGGWGCPCRGVVLLHRVYDLLLEAGVVVADNQRIHCPDPDWLKQVLLEDVRLPSLNGRMIIRAAFTNSDGRPFGPVAPVNDVDFDQPQAVAAALCKLWTAVADQPDTVRRDLIIQQQCLYEVKGLLFQIRPIRMMNIQ
jgi:hypothetical protein